MRSGRPVAAVTLAAAAALLAACGGSDNAPRATAVLPAPIADPSAIAAANLDRCPSTAGAGAQADLPDVPMPCLGAGPAVQLSALAGRPTVINVWATWCGPCRAELPHFQWLHEAAGESVRVLGVLYEDDPDGGLAFLQRLGVRFPSVLDSDGELKASRVVGLPATFFVAADGTTTLHLGEVKSQAELRDLVAARLRVAL